MDEPAPRDAPSGAILTIPNILTFARLGLTPVFLWLALGPDNIGAAIAVALTGFATDLIDGPIARRTGSVSRLGILLDPMADRIALAAGAVVFLVHDLAPLWAVLAVLGRDAALLLIGAPVLAATGRSIPPVSRVGKAGSFGVSIAFACFLASGIPGVDAPWQGVRTAGVVAAIVSLPLYYAAATGYVRVGVEALRSGRRPRAR